MISETYDTMARWDLGLSKKENLDRLRRENFIGAPSVTWLRDVAKVLNRRFEPGGQDRALVILAQGGCPIDEWKPILLWHLTRDEFLVRDFLVNWLFDAYEEGAFRLRPEDLHDYLRSLSARGGETEHPWTDATLARVAAGLLKIGVDFGLLTGTASKEFAGYHLPERSLVYLLHVILEYEHGSPYRMMKSPEWRMYLMRPADLETAAYLPACSHGSTRAKHGRSSPSSSAGFCLARPGTYPWRQQPPPVLLSSHTHDREAAASNDPGFPHSAAGHNPNGCCRTSEVELALDR